MEIPWAYLEDTRGKRCRAVQFQVHLPPWNDTRLSAGISVSFRCFFSFRRRPCSADNYTGHCAAATIARLWKQICIKTSRPVRRFVTISTCNVILCCMVLANVNSCSRSLYAIARPSVCLSSVTFVRPTQAVQIFGNMSTALGTLVIL